MKLRAQSFSVETRDGISLGAIECPDNFSWSREMNEVSTLTLSAPRQNMTTKIFPWHYWISCWDGQTLQWRGPIIDFQFDNAAMSFQAKDIGTFMWQTRTVTTRKWASLDIASIAADMWRDMLDLHSITAEPVVLPSLSGQGRYSVSVKADVRMLNQEVQDLVKLGLRWTVVKGRPVLGTQPPNIAAELGECHLSGGARIQRNGARTSNDVRVQGQNYSHTERVDMGGLHLQSIVQIDDTFGVANIVNAAREQALKRAQIRNALIIPAGATLTGDAPVELDTLVPGVRIAVTALGARGVFEIQKVSVSGSSSGTTVGLSLNVVNDNTQLETATGTGT